MSKQKVFLRSDGNYDMAEASEQSGLKCLDKSLTQQHLAEETDINWIVKRYAQTGEVPQHQLPPLNSDFAANLTFEQSMNLIVEARESFDALPSEIRTRFHNNPAEFVDFMSDAKNGDQIREMGLYNEEALQRWEDQQKAAKAAQEALQRDAEAYRASQKDTPAKAGKGVT